MKTNIKILVTTLSLLSLIFASSCKKDSDPVPTTPIATKTQLLTDKNWKMTALTVDPARPYVLFGPAVTDWYSQMKGCEQDNLYKYNTDSTLIFDEGATKCGTDDPQTVKGSWLFNSDQTIITQTIGSDTRSYTIIDLNATTLRARYTESSLGTNYVYTATLTAQ